MTDKIKDESEWKLAILFKNMRNILHAPGNEFHGMNVVEILACGVSNPFASEYTLIGEIDTHSGDIDFAEYAEPDPDYEEI